MWIQVKGSNTSENWIGWREIICPYPKYNCSRPNQNKKCF